MLQIKDIEQPSVFTPENLLREARRQKNIPTGTIPEICVLDPDGDIVKYLLKTNQAELDKHWACYHTNLYKFQNKEQTIGIIGNAVGASFAVLLAEQLFVSGCKLLISITSAGIINSPKNNSRFILIESALRDEGTSYHYLAPDKEATIHKKLADTLSGLFEDTEISLESGKSWTTDAPYRETQAAIDNAKKHGITAVEMEASALYAYGIAKKKNIICYAHLTNSMAQNEVDFEKGIENGSIDSLNLIYKTVNVLHELR
ncbi:MAG: nucleoside phosphorylase [Salinivirgaceae bacterium]|nr:nucleoside phosphorylase [Salinivirgaceae bacterium]